MRPPCGCGAPPRQSNQLRTDSAKDCRSRLCDRPKHPFHDTSTHYHVRQPFFTGRCSGTYGHDISGAQRFGQPAVGGNCRPRSAAPAIPHADDPGRHPVRAQAGANKTPAPVAFLFGSLLDKMLTMEHCRILLEAGYVCAALDAPGHGLDSDTSEPPELSSWRHRLEAGHDFVSAFNVRLSSILDYLIAERIADHALVIAVGGSRGGFLAFHFAGSDPRVRGVAGLTPVTELHALYEFRGMDDHKLTASLSPIRHAVRLAGRNVLVTIDDRDDRVGTDHAIALARQVSQNAGGARVDLHVLAEPRGHHHPKATEDLLRTWAAKCLRERSKR